MEKSIVGNKTEEDSQEATGKQHLYSDSCGNEVSQHTLKSMRYQRKIIACPNPFSRLSGGPFVNL